MGFPAIGALGVVVVAALSDVMIASASKALNLSRAGPTHMSKSAAAVALCRPRPEDTHGEFHGAHVNILWRRGRSEYELDCFRVAEAFDTGDRDARREVLRKHSLTDRRVVDTDDTNGCLFWGRQKCTHRDGAQLG